MLVPPRGRCRSSHGQTESTRPARVAAEHDLRVFLIAQARRCAFGRAHRRRNRRYALRIEFRRQSRAHLCLRCAVVQRLARFTRREFDRVRVLALALEKISQRLSYYSSRHQLRVHDLDGIIKGYPAEFLHHPPDPEHPRNLGQLASGARLQIVDYAPAIEGKLNPRPLKDGGALAVHFKIETAMMNQHLENWLLADDPQHGSFSMGLANIELKRGAAPTLGRGDSPNRPPSTSKNEEIDLEESIFAFSKAPDEQIGHVNKGGSTGAKVRLEPPENGNKGRVLISLSGKETSLDVAENVGRETQIEKTPFTLKIDNYWADFRIENGKPNSIS